MLHQVLADAAAVGHHGDAERRQLRRRTDAGAHQERWRMQRAHRDDDLARMDIAYLAMPVHPYAADARAIEQQALRTRATQHLEILPLPDFACQVSHGRGDAMIVGVADRNW